MAVELKVCGKNLWNKTAIDSAYGTNGTHYAFTSLTPNSFRLYLGPGSTDVWYNVKFVVPVRVGGTYSLSFKIKFISAVMGLLGVRVGYFSSLKTNSDSSPPAEYFDASYSSDATVNVSFTAFDEAVVVSFFKHSNSEFTVEVHDIQLEEGSSATWFEPYKEQKITLDTELYGLNGIYDEILPSVILKKIGVLKRGKSKNIITRTNNTNTYTLSISIPGTSGNPYWLVALTPYGKILPTAWNYNDEEHCYVDGSQQQAILYVSKSEVDAYTGANTTEKQNNYVNDMTIFYAFKTPQEVPLTDVLQLAPGYNNIILPYYTALSISGKYKYLEG